jgi:coiled-coil domain-containing protein 12
LTAIYALQDIFNIAPKRPNWDLKREMEKKLAKLERKTQESIHTLIRESTIILPLYLYNHPSEIIGQRLAAQKGDSDDLVGAMRAQETQNASETLFDDED